MFDFVKRMRASEERKGSPTDFQRRPVVVLRLAADPYPIPFPVKWSSSTSRALIWLRAVVVGFPESGHVVSAFQSGIGPQHQRRWTRPSCRAVTTRGRVENPALEAERPNSPVRLLKVLVEPIAFCNQVLLWWGQTQMGIRTFLSGLVPILQAVDTHMDI